MMPGLAVLLLVLQVWGFFLPLKFAGIGIGMLGVWALRHGVGSVLNSNGRLPAQGDRHGAWKKIAVLLVCIMPAVLPAWVNDDFAYYLPGIKWFAGEGWVPGLANLNVRFGLSSSWHALSAAFYWEGISPDRIWNFNGLLLFLFCKELLDRFPDKPFAVWGALLFGVPFCNAPSPDLPVALMGAYALINLKTFSFKDWMWWAVLLIGLKATALSVLILFPLAFASITKKNWPWLVLPALACLVWIGKNMVLTGHPFFPYALFEQVNSYPAVLLAAFREGVLAEIYGVGFSMEEWRLADLSAMDRLLQLGHLKGYKIVMNLLVLTGTITLLIVYLKKEKKQFLAALLIVCGFLFWLFVTPNYRFFLAPVFAAGYFIHWKKLGEWRYSSFLILIPLSIAVWMNRGNPDALRVVSCADAPALSFGHVLVPVPYAVPDYELIPLKDSLEVYRPLDCMYCGDVPRPCYPDTVRGYNAIYGYGLGWDGKEFGMRLKPPNLMKELP
ncbi:MAG TPA: hypothetical protein DIW47_09220 [Bacteroidetes bacterium]|nr:hypothetical protein [Bacteroidota bacterium]